MNNFFNDTNRTNTDIVELILEDHKPLKELIRILKNAKGDAGDRFEAFEKFAPLLLSHAKPEEESLYVFLKDDDELILEGMEGDTEHALASQLVDEIYDTADENLWSAKVKVLAELVEHHIKEEEGSMLPDFKKHSTPEERASIGEEYLKLRDQMNNMNVYQNNSDSIDSIQAH